VFWSAVGLPPLCKTACSARKREVRIDIERIEKQGQALALQIWSAAARRRFLKTREVL
jgi:hypothetical protein